MTEAADPRHVMLFGATGTIGRAVHGALLARGWQVTTLGRSAPPGFAGAHVAVDLADPEAVTRTMARIGRRGAVVSCLASRSGAPADAWFVDHAAHLGILRGAEAAEAGRFVLLSAICVQKPRLAFQHAKLAFEAALTASAVPHSIVRPTAYFKSLSGQFARVRAGKPFVMFGDGGLTACKPISDRDLADYLAECLDRPDQANRILPIGGPGPALTPRAQGGLLFAALGREPRFARVPLALMHGIVGGLSLGGIISARLRAKADLARIGRYYATESMLVWDEAAGRYDADATPETGRDTLAEHYARLARGEITVDLGDHAVF